MASNLLLSSDELAIMLNEYGLVQSLTFPHVGSEQHMPGLVHKIGVWVDGQMSWLDDGSWQHKARYQHGALAGHTVMTNDALELLIECDDIVITQSTALIRHFHIVNLSRARRTVRLFLHQAFQMGGTVYPDTAQYLHDDAMIMHRGGRRVMVATGVTDVGQSADQYSVGLFGNGKDGTWRDAEDGELANCDYEAGMVDSTLRFSLTIGGLSSRRVHYWLTAGTSMRMALQAARQMKKKGLVSYVDDSLSWWHAWLSTSRAAAHKVAPKFRLPFEQSLLMIRSRLDRRGGLITDMHPGGQSGCAPHVAAYALWPLVRLGYYDDALKFFTFCRQSLADTGHVRPLYNPDGSIGVMRLPDSETPSDTTATAMVLMVFSHLYSLKKHRGLLNEYYTSFIVPMADFLTEATDETGLPLVDDHGPTLYATGLSYAALMTAADMAQEAKDTDAQIRWRTAAEQMHDVGMTAFRSNTGLLQHSRERTLPSIPALFGAFMFGLYGVDEPIIKDSVIFLERAQRRDDGLFMNDRAEVDYVHSLWMAQYYMEADRRGDALAIITAVIDALKRTTDLSDELAIRAELMSALLDTMTRA